MGDGALPRRTYLGGDSVHGRLESNGEGKVIAADSAPRQDTDSGALRTGLTAATCLVLAALAAFQVVYVMPTYLAMMEGLGVGFSWPTRLALGIGGGYSWLVLVAGTAGLIALFVRGRQRPEARRALGTALSGTALLLAVYVVLLSWTWVDVAILGPWDR